VTCCDFSQRSITEKTEAHYFLLALITRYYTMQSSKTTEKLVNTRLTAAPRYGLKSIPDAACIEWVTQELYTLSEAWSGVNWVDLVAAQGAFGTDFYDRSTLRPKHRAYYRSGRPAIKIGRKGALGSHEIRPIHSAPSLGQSIEHWTGGWGMLRVCHADSPQHPIL